MVKKRLSAWLAIILLLQMFVSAGVASASSASAFTAGLLSVTLDTADTGGKVVLGKDATVDVKITNTSPTDWAYNVGIQTILDDGVQVSPSQSPAPTSAPKIDNASGAQTSFWQDVKNLAPNETYVFPVAVNSLDTFRKQNGGGSVPFGQKPNMTVNVYASSNPRDLYSPGEGAASATGPLQLTIVPFTIRITGADKQVKGAGTDEALPGSGSEYGEYAYAVDIDNNSRAQTHFNSLANTVFGGLELYAIDAASGSTAPSATADYANNRQSFDWGAFDVAAGDTKTLTFKAAFFDNEMSDSHYNQGTTRIEDGDQADNTLSYNASTSGVGTPFTGTVNYSTIAKDIVITKSVDKQTVGYSETLTYTLKVTANEYYDVTNVVITDTIGDGQDYVNGSASGGAVFGGASAGDNGTTVLTWSIDSLTAKTSQTFTYQTTVLTSWKGSHSNGAIVANDSLTNSASVTGETAASGSVGDSAATTVHVIEPGVAESIAKVNGSAPSSSQTASVTVGDHIAFTVHYDASAVNVKQHNVELFDYLPLDTLPLDANSDSAINDADVAGYTLNGVAPSYVPSMNAIVWTFPSDLAPALDQSVDVIAVVQNPDDWGVVKSAQNLVVVSYQNSDGQIVSKRDSVSLAYADPNIAITRKVNGSSSVGNVDGGDTVTVSVYLTNNSDFPAYNVNFTEMLPAELTNPQQVGTDYFTPNSTTPSNLEFGQMTSIPAKSTVTVQYKADIVHPVGALRDITQQSKVAYDSQASGIAHQYTSNESRKTMQVNNVTITKTLVEVGSGSGASAVIGSAASGRAGDWAVYDVKVQLNPGDIAYNPVLTDTLPQHQSLLAVMSDYTTSGGTAHTGTVVPNTDYTYSGAAGGTVKFTAPTLAVSAGGLYEYFMKTNIDQITNASPFSEDQQSKAKFVWDDLSSGGVNHTATSGNAGPTVKGPNLTGALTPTSATLEMSDPPATFKFTLTNNGAGTAYDFVPVLNVPSGYRIETATASGGGSAALSPDGDGINTTATFQRRNLAAGVSESFQIAVSLLQVKGSGASFNVNATSGPYYATDEAYQADSGSSAAVDNKVKFAAASGVSQLIVPGVLLQNVIHATSNAADTVSTLPGASANIRPGDTVDYELTLTVPAATQAYGIKIDDTIAGLGSQFKLLGVTLDSTATGATYSQTGNVLTLSLGDSPSSSTQPTVYTNTLHLRANEDGSSPTTGSFQTGSQPFTTSAAASWKPTSGDSYQSGTAAATTVTVLQPNVTVAANGIADPQFSDSNLTIAAGYTLANTGSGPAYVPSFEVAVPSGLNPTNISDGGTFSGGKITWTNIAVPGASSGSATKSLTFDLQATTQVGAGTSGLTLTPAIDHYESTPKDKTDQTAKVYVLAPSASQALSVAPVQLTASVTANTYGTGITDSARPGDSLTYTLTVNPPGTATAYHTVLLNQGLLEQSIVIVAVDGNDIPYSSADGGYVLGDISGDKNVTVVAKTAVTGDHVPNPYTGSFQPTIAYLSASGDSAAKTAAAANMQQSVYEPDLSIGISADKTQLHTAGEKSAFVVTVSNTHGTSTAYGTQVRLTVADAVYLSQVAPAGTGESVTNDATNLTWTIDSIPAGTQRQLTFNLGAQAATTVTTSVYVHAELNPYFSLPGSGGKTYGPLATSQIGVEVFGLHVLSLSGSAAVTAGQDASFDHTLTNTGAGADTFLFTVQGDYPAELYADGVKIASGRTVNGAWVWDSITAGYAVGGVPGIVLPAAGTTSLKLVAHVPEDAPYSDTAHVYTLAAAGQSSGNNSSTQDRVTVTGIALDGWSGSQERSDWVLPAYGHGDSLVLNAVSAVNAQAVSAIYDGGTPSPEIGMTLVNNTTYAQDGYKRWYAVTRLADDIASGSYGVTFVAKDAQGGVLETDEQSGANGANGANNPFKAIYRIKVKGTAVDQTTGAAVPGANVQLIDPASGKLIAETTSDANGDYSFTDVTVNRYRLVVSNQGYADSEQDFYALPKDGTTDVVEVDAILSPFRITLTANPSTLLGDGMSQTELTAVVTALDGTPASGVTVTFNAGGNGSFPSGTTAVTDENGVAKLPFRSDVVTGAASKRISVTSNANDPVRKLSASAQLVVVFDPGAVTGIVTEMVNGSPQPVAGAKVVVSKDFNNDGITDFTATAMTKADGSYLIAVPRGNVVYDLTVTKAVQVGGTTSYVDFPQTVAAGTISSSGGEVFPADKTVSGVVLGLASDKMSMSWPKALYSTLKGYLLDSGGNVVTKPDGTRLDFPIGDNGTFNAQNVAAGSYQLVIVSEVEPGKELILNRKSDGTQPKLQVQQNGEMNIDVELIDPFGTVTDASTGAIIEGAHVELRYADTARNRGSGRTPGALVALPELIGFAPNDNHNPQDTDTFGKYAYMVYGFTDYVVVANKPGYETYRSPIISVESAIVRHDFKMQQVSSDSDSSAPAAVGSGTAIPSAPVSPDQPQADVAVDLFTDRAAYPEGDLITYTVQYVNKSDIVAAGVVITGQIPSYTLISDAGGGTVDKASIVWKLGDLAPKASGKLVYQVQVGAGLLPQPEQVAHNTVGITATTSLVNLKDDSSDIAVLLFDPKAQDGQHKRYIAGYPDGQFKEERSITRAEIAAIFGRIMNLQSTVKGDKLYSDVDPASWYGGYVEAVSHAGLFGGYEDNSFKPDQAITRAELSMVISRYLKLDDRPPVLVHFPDIAGHWAENGIEQIYRHHIIDGYPDGTFKPNANMIRSEAVTMINRLLYRGPLHGADVMFPDVTPDHWDFGQVEESAVSHRYTREADGSETMSEAIADPLW